MRWKVNPDPAVKPQRLASAEPGRQPVVDDPSGALVHPPGSRHVGESCDAFAGRHRPAHHGARLGV